MRDACKSNSKRRLGKTRADLAHLTKTRAKLYDVRKSRTLLSRDIRLYLWLSHPFQFVLQCNALSCKGLLRLISSSFASKREYTLSTIRDMSYNTKWLLSKRYIQAVIIITLMTLGIAIPFFKTALALTDIGCDQTATTNCTFELDGNIVRQSTNSTGLPTDWGALFDSAGNNIFLPPGGLDAHWVNDGPHHVPDNTTFTTGSKDTLDIANGGWQCSPSNNLTPKDDILHAYSFGIIPLSGPRKGDTLLYGGFERFANNGAGNVGFWLLQDSTVNCPNTGKAADFMGAHETGDLLITANFTIGGSVTALRVFQWVGISKATPSGLNSTTANIGTDCSTASPSVNICARSNPASIPVTPWTTQDKTSSANNLATAEFFEVGLDLTRLNPGICVNKFLFDTRSSPSSTATLFDYALGALTSCPAAKISTSVSPTPIALGSSATDTATVTLSSGNFQVSGTVTFNVYGPFSSDPTGNSGVCTPGNLVTTFSPDTKTIGPAASPASVTSDPFIAALAGYYAWTATYNPASIVNGGTNSTRCGDTAETLLVIGTMITTSVSPTPITLGGSASDTATVTLTPSTATVLGTVTFNVYGPFTSAPTSASCTSGSLVTPFSPNTKSIGPATGSASVTSDPFTPSAPGFYAWIATYNPTAPVNGNIKSTTCGETTEILLVHGIPKITAFDFTNTPTNNDPTLGSGSVTYSFTIRNYGASAVTLSGSLTVSPASLATCTGGNTLALSGSLAAFGSSGDSATFMLSCTYSGNSGDTVSATIDAMFAVGGGVAHEVSGSPATYTFTIQKI